VHVMTRDGGGPVPGAEPPDVDELDEGTADRGGRR
jgi:hypothetical protein